MNIIEQLGDVPLFKPILNTLTRWELTDRAVVLDPLGSLDRMIQAGPAHVDVLAVVIGGEQLQQAGKDHVVIVVHVAKPPGKEQSVSAAPSHRLVQSVNVFTLLTGVKIDGQHVLLPAAVLK